MHHPMRQGLLDFLAGQGPGRGPQHLREIVGIRGAELLPTTWRRAGRDMKEDIRLHIRSNMRSLHGILHRGEELGRALAGILEEERVVVQRLAQRQQPPQWTGEGDVVGQRDGAKIVEHALHLGPTAVGAQGHCAACLREMQGGRSIRHGGRGARGGADGGALWQSGQELCTGRQING